MNTSNNHDLVTVYPSHEHLPFLQNDRVLHMAQPSSFGRKMSENPTDFVQESSSRCGLYKSFGRHTWTLEDFLMRSSVQDDESTEFSSSTFSIFVSVSDSLFQEVSLRIKLRRTKHQVSPNEPPVEMYGIFLQSCSPEHFKALTEFSIVNRDDVEIRFFGHCGYGQQKQQQQQHFKQYFPGLSWGYNDFINVNDVRKNPEEFLTDDGALVISCRIVLSMSCWSDRPPVPRYNPNVNVNNLSNALDIMSLQNKKDKQPVLSSSPSRRIFTDNIIKGLEENLYTDFKLIAGGQEFPCHRFILAARSDTLKMFLEVKSAISEGEDRNKMEIENIEPEVLKELLHFIYTDEVTTQGLARHARALLEASFRYNLPKLEQLCVKSLLQGINAYNIMMYVHLADMYPSRTFLQGVADFIAENIQLVMKNGMFDEIVDNHPPVAKEIMKTITTKAAQASAIPVPMEQKEPELHSDSDSDN